MCARTLVVAWASSAYPLPRTYPPTSRMPTSTPAEFDTWFAALQGTAKVEDFLQIVGRDLLRSEVLKAQEFGEKKADPL
eukprot:COSAG02_NODE_42046_length_388_cov_0.937716_1_plen_78_part_10